MRTIIENGTVVTMNPAGDVLTPGWVEIVDGTITQVLSTPLAAVPGDQWIDASGLVVMPGLVNAHTHLFQTLIRGVYEHLPFTEWLRRIYFCGRVLTAEDCFIGARLGSLEAIRSGVTTLVDHQFLNRGLELPQATVAGMRSIGVRTVLARTIMDLGDLAPPEVIETPEEGLRSVETLLSHYDGQIGDMLTLMTGPNTPGVSATGELSVATKQFADAHGLRISAHIAESASVVDLVRERYGKNGVVRWLDELGALGPNVIAAHSVHLSQEEVGIFAERGVAVAHNPVSNMFLGDGIAPIVAMIEAGVTVALGTDGAASNNSQDMFEVMKFGALLQRAYTQDPHAILSEQALRMATINGAKALGLNHAVGSLEVGKRADIILVNLLGAAHNVAVHNVVSHLVHCAKATDVEMVMVDGRILMEHGEVLGLDEPKLLSKAQQVGTDLVARLD